MTTTLITHTLGIDIAKAKFDVALHRARAAPTPVTLNKYHLKDKTAVFEQSPAGFEALLSWLGKYGIDLACVHVAMEATGIYYEELAAFLCSKGLLVSVVNPALISGYAKANLTRTKTDKADAKLIASYCDALQPAPWLAPAPQVRHLRELTRRLVALKDLHQQESNRLSQARCTHDSITLVMQALAAQMKLVTKAIKEHIKQHADLKEQSVLLDSIPGIGAVTIGTLLAEIEFSRFERAPQLAAFAGLAPKIRESGSSVRGRGVLSKAGSSGLRCSLYMPAVVAMKHNPLVKRFYTRLLANGKSKMQAICACMRKLLAIAFGILKSKQPFNPNYGLAT